MGKLKVTNRAKALIAGVMALAATSGWTAFQDAQPNDQMTKPAVIEAVNQGMTPPAVLMAVEIIKDWEGLKTTAYLDTLPTKPVWTVCYGETKGVKRGDSYTPAQCEAMLTKRVLADFYMPLVKDVKNFTFAPDGVQASMVSGAYNYGVGAAKTTTGGKLIAQGKFLEGCNALTAWNKAGGKKIRGLVLRRENGDTYRIGEGELCVTSIAYVR